MSAASETPAVSWPDDEVALPLPRAEELGALADKYRRLAALRQQKNSAADARQALRELSQAFPGSLREIDVLALSTLEARAAELTALLERGAVQPPNEPSSLDKDSVANHLPGGAEPDSAVSEMLPDAELPLWVRAVHGYHRVMALCLWLKPALRRASADQQADLLQEASDRFGVWLSPAWAQVVRTPPEGRLNTVVFALLDAALGLTPNAARGVVFPMEAGAHCSHGAEESRGVVEAEGAAEVVEARGAVEAEGATREPNGAVEAPAPKQRELLFTTHERLSDIGRETWERLRGAAPPMLSYDWLEALEDTGCVSRREGWLPMHLALRDAASHEPLVLAPAYLKAHSQGEFVFDQGWAQFCEQRLGAPYYPKLIIAVPFTPATGPRLLVAPGESLSALLPAFMGGVMALCERFELSGAHLLFPSREQAAMLSEEPALIERHGVQFHFTNPGYTSFEDFLGRFSSKRRNQIRRERRALVEQGVELQVCGGAELDAERVDEAFELYLTTVRKFYWGRQYLNRAFFEQVFQRMPSALQVVRAVPRGSPHARGRALAGAINLVGEEALYGRYWGAFRELRHLHFNVCYYRGVEHCIEAGLRRFEPGAGGEHKLARGFDPTLTPSFHFLTDSRLRGPVMDHVAREREAIREMLEER
ncbi:MAG: GNAT family N-acetyltransferase [Polyangiaceae bacterium]|nr:GNAT family N-acetyltransferase [Polyangiaceae bacterium]